MQNSEYYRKPLECNCNDSWGKPYKPHEHDVCHDLDRLYEKLKSLVINEGNERKEIDKKIFIDLKHLQKHIEKSEHDIDAVKRTLKQFWDMIPDYSKLVTRDFLIDILKDYYTKKTCDELFTTRPISDYKIIKAAEDIF